MTFQNPLLLLLLVLLVPAGMIMRKSFSKSKRVLNALQEQTGGARRRAGAALALMMLFLASVLVVASGPRRYIVDPAEARSGSFVFLIDASRSMAARARCGDPMPLDAARALMADVVTGVPQAGFAFAVFTELTFPLSELSYDRQYLLEIIENGVFTEVVPAPGSDLANAFHVVLEKKTGQPPLYAGVEQVILLSDGDLPEGVLEGLDEAVPRLKEANVQVISVGVGSEQARPIPTLNDAGECLEGRYERAEGKEFYTHLFDGPLRAIAEETGGRYFHVSERDAVIAYLQSLLTERPGAAPPVQTEDISHIFLVLATLSMLGLVGVQRP